MFRTEILYHSSINGCIDNNNFRYVDTKAKNNLSKKKFRV